MTLPGESPVQAKEPFDIVEEASAPKVDLSEPTSTTIEESKTMDEKMHGEFSVRLSKVIHDINTNEIIEEISGKNKTGGFATYFNLYKILVGIGVLALPMAIRLAGLVLGFFGMSLICLMSYYSLRVNAESKQQLGR